MRVCVCVGGGGTDARAPQRVTRHEGEELARRAGVPYYEASAVTGEGVHEAWDGLIMAVKQSLDGALREARGPAKPAAGGGGGRDPRAGGGAGTALPPPEEARDSVKLTPDDAAAAPRSWWQCW